MRIALTAILSCAPIVCALSQNRPTIADPDYPVGLYVPYEAGGRWGFADTLNRILVQPVYDSVRMPARDGIVDENFRVGYRDGKTQVFLGNPPTVLPGDYDELVSIFRLRGPAFNTEGIYVVQRVGRLYDVVGPDAKVLVDDASEIIPGSRFGTDVGVLARRSGGAGYRLYGTTGKPLTTATYTEYIDTRLPKAIEDSLGGNRPSLYNALVVSETEYHYIGYEGIWTANPRDGSGFRQLLAIDRSGSLAVAAGTLTQAQVDSITGPPPPPPAPPAPPPFNYAEGEVPVLRRYINSARTARRYGPRVYVPRRATLAELIPDSTTTVVDTAAASADLDGGRPDLSYYEEILRAYPPLKPPRPSVYGLNPADVTEYKERLAIGRQARSIIERSMGAYRRDSIQRQSTALRRLGVDSLGRTFMEEYVRGAYLPALQLAYLPDGLGILDRAEGRLLDVRLDSISNVVLAFVDRAAVYYVAGEKDGRAQLVTDAGERVLPGDYDRISYDYNKEFFEVRKGGKVGIYQLGTTYGFIEPNYSSIIEVFRLPVSDAWQFLLYEVELGSRRIFVGENGMQYTNAY